MCSCLHDTNTQIIMAWIERRHSGISQGDAGEIEES